MLQWRRPDLPSYLFALCLGVALLLPEVEHSLAHHHAAEHRASAPHPLLNDLPLGSTILNGGVIADEDGAADHPHLDVVATPPARPVSLHALILVVPVLALTDLVVERPLPPILASGPPPGDWTHGPPPPSRAPPQV